MDLKTNINSKPCHLHPFVMQNTTCFLKTEINEEEFCMGSVQSNKGTFLQEFQHLDHLSLVGSSFNPDLQTPGFDSFDPFSTGSSSSLAGFGFSDFRPFDHQLENNDNNVEIPATQEEFEGVGGNFLSFKSAQEITPLVQSDQSNLLSPACVAMSFAAAEDQSSGVTADNFHHKERKDRERNNNYRIFNNNNSSSSSTRRAIRVGKKSKSSKGQWTVEEDRLLIQLVGKFGVRKWSHIAQTLKGRIGKQCRERWHNHLRPDIKKDIWTEDEDRILIETHAEIGNKWAEIAKKLSGRTENSIKNHWNATKRRQLSRRKCRTKWPKPSTLLQNYIKSLNFDTTNTTSRRSRKRSAATSTANDDDHRELAQNYDDHDFTEEVPEFVLDDKMLMFNDDGIGNEPDGLAVDDDDQKMEIYDDIVPPFEVKKELELMEMINTVNV